MIANNLAFTKYELPGGLCAEPLQVASNLNNIVAIFYIGYDKHSKYDNSKHIWRVSMAAMAANEFAPGMKAVIAGSNDAFTGQWTIKEVRMAVMALPAYVDIYTPFGREHHVLNNGGVGTVTAGGTVEQSIVVPGFNFINNNGTAIVRTYATSESFVYMPQPEVMNSFVQVTNGGTAQVAIAITWSLDRVNWIAFPTPIAGNVAAGTTAGFVVAQGNMNGIYIRIQATVTAGANYYILAR